MQGKPKSDKAAFEITVRRKISCWHAQGNWFTFPSHTSYHKERKVFKRNAVTILRDNIHSTEVL